MVGSTHCCLGKMAQEGKVPVAEADNLSSNPVSHVLEGEKQLLRVVV